MTERMELNCLGMKCPRPIIEIAKVARKLPPASTLGVAADDLAFESDVQAWAEQAGAFGLNVIPFDSQSIEIHFVLYEFEIQRSGWKIHKMTGTSAVG